MSDKLLRQTVIEQLDFDPAVESAHIAVAVDEGVVTLSGRVSSYQQKVNAEKAVRSVKGVRGIAEEIEVRYDNGEPPGDVEIAKRALAALALNALLPEDDDAIRVMVSHGRVILSGQVDWQYQREAAEAEVAKLRGVVGVDNQLTLNPRAFAVDIRKSLDEALARTVLKNEAVHIQVEGDRVVADGSVDCWSDLQLVERLVWSIPGVRSFENRLRIVKPEPAA